MYRLLYGTGFPVLYRGESGMEQENRVMKFDGLDLTFLRVEMYWSISMSNVASFSSQFTAAPEMCRYARWAGSIENDELSSQSDDGGVSGTICGSEIIMSKALNDGKMTDPLNVTNKIIFLLWVCKGMYLCSILHFRDLREIHFNNWKMKWKSKLTVAYNKYNATSSFRNTISEPLK